MISIRLPNKIRKEIKQIVYASSFETGVTLFGKRRGDAFEILHVCGPGPTATHEALHYSGDNDYASDFYNDLLKTDPDLKHLGELHVHPFGMKNLSGGDRSTIHEVLKTYKEFIAGVMLRRRGRVEIYPMYFSRQNIKGVKCELTKR